MKMIKKITISAIVLVLAFIFAFTVNVNAEDVATSDQLTVEGASIRTTGERPGMRFVGSVGNYDTKNVVEYGIAIAFGEAEADNNFVVDGTVGGKAVLSASDSASTNGEEFYVVLYNIPDTSYTQKVTARAYVKLDDDSYVYGTSVVVRSIGEVASYFYNLDDTYSSVNDGNLVKTVAETLGVKLSIDDDRYYYYTDFTTDFNTKLKSKDDNKTGTVEVEEGSYDELLNISESNVLIAGPQANVSINNDGTRTGNEATIKRVQINSNVNNVSINGFTIQGNENCLRLYNSQSNITFMYNICKPTSNSAIIDGAKDSKYTDYTHSNIVIKNNYTHCEVTNKTDVDAGNTYTLDINIRGNVSNIDIEDNYFSSANTTLSSKDYGINLAKVVNGSYINVKNNTFNKLGSNYIINIATGHTTSTRINAYINIQGNQLTTASSTFLGGNGIRVLYLGADSIVNINNNTICTSVYNNAILLSTNTAASSSAEGVNTKVNINNNEFYSFIPTTKQKLIDESKTDHFGINSTTTRSIVSKNNTRIGIGISECVFSAENNYNATEFSNYGYLDLNKATGASSKVSMTTDHYVTNKDTTVAAVGTYNTALSAFENFVNNFTSTTTIPTEYTFLNYSGGKLYYSGSDAAYAIAVLKVGGVIGNAPSV